LKKHNKINFNLALNNKIYQYFYYFLLFYSLYCAIILGESWDEADHAIRGKATFQYLLSFGKIKKEYFYDEFYSPSYWFFQYFFSQLFNLKYQTEVNHIINLIISISAIIGFYKLISELFNKFLGKIIFLILFFYPIFFGHMSINPKDTVVAFCNIWIFYLLIKYLKNQHNINKSNRYIFGISILFAIGSGVQLLFLGSLIPVLLFFFFEIFFFKKIINKKFNFKILLIHFFKFIFIFYIFLILFWPATHANILLLPFQFFIKSLSLARGWEWNLLNGEIVTSKNVSFFYFYINFFFKSPEFLFFNYILFFFLIFIFFNFFKKEFSNFLYKILFLSIFLLMPCLIIILSSFGAYDGIRLFLWCIPYFCIIPSLTIYFLLKNIKKIILRFFLYINFLLIIIYFIFFLSITPYHYTYLNLFNFFSSSKLSKFEGDYWNVSIKELVKKIDFSKDTKFDIVTCGINRDLLKKYLKIYQNDNLKKVNFVDYKDAKYVLMTERVVNDVGNNINSLTVDTCYNKYSGSNFVSVERLSRDISVIRIIKPFYLK
jgi:hypothetical protein